MIQVTAFRWLPEFARGYARDLRVRWALEEAGVPYGDDLIGFEDQATPAYRARQPFGQIPVYREHELEMFESGAIVLHVAGRSDALMPADEAGRAHVLTWVIAALNSMEPHTEALGNIDTFHVDEAWTVERRPQVETFVRSRLASLAEVLKDRDWLVGGRFTAADLVMATVLRGLEHTDLVSGDPVLGAYVRRCEDRPAFRRAMADHVAPSLAGDAARAAA